MVGFFPKRWRLLQEIRVLHLDIQTIRRKTQLGEYLVESHVILHALKEGFDRRHVVEAL